MIKASQSDKIIAHLADVGPLTALGALDLCNCWRLGARVLDLKRQGHQIITDMITTESGKRIAQYRLIQQPAVDKIA